MTFIDPEVYRVVDSMALAREALNEFAAKLERSSRFGGVTTGVDLRRYGSEPVWEVYVEAELPNGDSLCWWLEVRHQDQQWAIEAKVFAQTTQGQETLVSVVDRVLPSTAAIPDEIRIATIALLATADSLPAMMLSREQKA